eukprot:1955695-Lingulodinium_polyedra.AAC.1
MPARALRSKPLGPDPASTGRVSSVPSWSGGIAAASAASEACEMLDVDEDWEAGDPAHTWPPGCRQVAQRS